MFNGYTSREAALLFYLYLGSDLKEFAPVGGIYVGPNMEGVLSSMEASGKSHKLFPIVNMVKKNNKEFCVK